MSTLDTAFIKAFEKNKARAAHDGAAASAGTVEAAASGGASRGGAPAPDASPSDAKPAAPAPRHRADEVYHAAGPQLQGPHAAFPPSAAPVGLTYVNAYYGPLPPGASAVFGGQQVVPPAPAAVPASPAGEPARSDGLANSGAVQASQQVTVQPSSPGLDPGAAGAWSQPLTTEEAKRTLEAAASLKLPEPLGLPLAFEAMADEAQHRLDAETFSPEWEVDRFAWPEVCKKLLEAESGYFQHVGARLKAATSNGRHVLLVTGSRRQEGRTTLALCLARCAAEAGVGVAIVDADLKNPQLGASLGIETPCSWLQVIVDKAPLDEAAVASVEDRLTLFPLARSEYVDMPETRLAALLQSISKHYPLVIVDAGPLDSDGRAPFASMDRCPVDAAIVVRDLRHANQQQALATARRLKQAGVAAVGIAENFKS